MYDFNVLMIGVTQRTPLVSHYFSGLDVTESRSPAKKDSILRVKTVLRLNQASQLDNPDSRVSTSELASTSMSIGDLVECYQGVVTGDLERFRVQFWEVQ